MTPLPHSPAAERNKEPILAVLRQILPERGMALEIASGTGQHAAWFASNLPHWTWQPTEHDGEMLDAIAARLSQAGVTNVLAPRQVDVSAADWQVPREFDAIFCANMLHIAPWGACIGLMNGAARHLAPGGVLVTYGPYFEEGIAPAPSNVAFDESLRARDPSWGIRELKAVDAAARKAGLTRIHRHEMPANNLLLVFRKD